MDESHQYNVEQKKQKQTTIFWGQAHIDGKTIKRKEMITIVKVMVSFG